MTEKGFTITPAELVTLHDCLSSKICVNIFRVLLSRNTLNISAVSRKVGCTNNDALKHLKNLTKLGIVHEEFYSGRHTFTLKNGQLTELMKQAMKIMEAKG
jgi:predicted transcriptional regulator